MAFDFKARLAAEKEELAKEEALLTQDDLDEIAGRTEIEKIRSQKQEAVEKRLELDLDRREDAAKARHSGKQVKAKQIKNRPDSFVLVDPGPAAYRLYLKTLHQVHASKKDPTEAHIEYAVASIEDWNGLTDWNAIIDGKTAGDRLNVFLKQNPAVALQLANDACELAGFAEKERKS